MFEILKIIGYAKDAYKIQQDIYDKLKHKIIIGDSGGGMVKIEINGQFEVLKVLIEDNIFSMNDKFFLQDMILSAFNDAIKNAKVIISEEMKEFINKAL